jgi:signal transduction histidine kinase/phage shock protein PspC (stress-responsive transcriptional regulator)
MSAMPPPRSRPPLRRLPQDGVLGGVCAGIAVHVGAEVVYVRAAMVLLTAFGGAGLAIYALGWALLPPAAVGASTPHCPGSWAPDAHDPGQFPDAAASADSRAVFGIALLAVGGLLALRQLGLWLGDEVVWPLVLGSAGVALIWRQADAGAAWTPAELRHPLAGVRTRLRHGRGSDGRRTALGVALVALAAFVLLSSTGTLDAVGDALGGIVVIVAAAALIFWPWLTRFAGTLAAERTERIRSQERAEVAAHLHDSVLQTLALIQKRAGDPREVAALARRQERELRNWLTGRAQRPAGESLAAALEQVAEEIERRHGVPVEVVTVGDCPLDARLDALVQAAREALANAAKFAGSAKVDLYAEVTDARVEAFVRDRGVGFDPAAIPDDRRGVRESIVGRMERNGGRAVVHAAPGAGTEVELVVEREAVRA